MAKANQYLPFATGTGANVYSYATYAGSAARPVGYAAGIADAQHINNVLRQVTVGVAGLAQLAADYGTIDVNDDGLPATFESAFKSALDALYAPISALKVSDFTGANQSFATNGFQKFPGGFIVQWGTSATIPTDTAGTGISFPTPFPHACLAVIATPTTNNGISTSTLNYSWGVYGKTVNGFYLNNDALASAFGWIAIGY